MSTATPILFSPKISNSFWIAILSLFVLGLLAPRLMAFLPSLLAIGFIITAYVSQRLIIKPNIKELTLFGLLLALAFLSSLWSYNPEFSLERSFKLVPIIIPGVFLLSIARHVAAPTTKHLMRTILGLYFIATFYLVSQELTSHALIEFVLGSDRPDFQLNRSFIIYAFIALVTLYFVKKSQFPRPKKITVFVALVALTVLTLCFAKSQTAQLSFLCGLFFLIIWPTKSHILEKTLFGGLIVLCLSLPSIIHPLKNTIPEEMLLEGILKQASIVHRFEVWEFTVNEIKESPIYGNGIESQRFMKSDKWMEHQKSDSILHAHNVILQIWIEFGIIGILLGISILLYIYKAIYHVNNFEKRKLYLMIFTACFCCAMTGYGVWQGWQVGSFFALSAAVIGLKNIKNGVT